MTGPRLIDAAELLVWRQQQLARGGRAVDLDWLLDLRGGVPWTRLQRVLLDPMGPVAVQCDLESLAELWSRHLCSAEPLQHLVGLCPWRDLLLETTAAALIPRQETELLVDLALSCWKDQSPGCWADLGTGSGAMAVSLSRAWPAALGHAVDLSAEALQLAQRNLQALAPEHRCSLHLGSWWEPLRDVWGTLDLVVSNPPYIPRSLIPALDPVVRDHEPHLALVGGDDGLDAIRILLENATTALAPGGWLLLEHHHDQSQQVLALMADVGMVDVDWAADLEGIRRFARGRRRSDHDA